MTACLLFCILVGNLEKVYQGMPLVVQRYFLAILLSQLMIPCITGFLLLFLAHLSTGTSVGVHSVRISWCMAVKGLETCRCLSTYNAASPQLRDL